MSIPFIKPRTRPLSSSDTVKTVSPWEHTDLTEAVRRHTDKGQHAAPSLILF